MSYYGGARRATEEDARAQMRHGHPAHAAASLTGARQGPYHVRR
jgi:hypothetical protein